MKHRRRSLVPGGVPAARSNNLSRRSMALRMITAGESHGPGLTCIVEGLPAGLELDPEAIDLDMARRQLGHGRGGRMKIETDRAFVTAGVRHGRTLGGPVALQVANRDYTNWDERMSPWPVDAEVPEVHLPRPGHADLVGAWKYGHTRRPQRARARQRARDGGARGGWCRLPRLSWPRSAWRFARTSCRSGPSRRRSAARRWRVADFDRGRREPGPLPRRRVQPRDGRAHQRAAQGQRVDRRRVRGDRVRPRTRPRLARLLGDAARRAHRGRDLLDPGRQGRDARRGLRDRREAGLRGARRDLLRRGARLLPRDESRRRPRGRDDDGRAAASSAGR